MCGTTLVPVARPDYRARAAAGPFFMATVKTHPPTP
jgi:hypothetical protein